jgi:hypothetical protein
MASITHTRLGNLRLAGIACTGYPDDPWSASRRVHEELQEQGFTPQGAVQIWFSLPPDGDPATWHGTIGHPFVGLARPTAELVIEDYRDLRSLSLPHPGPIAELGLSHQQLQSEAGRQRARLRPYWRVSLARQALSDGSLLPQATVSVFVDEAS